MKILKWVNEKIGDVWCFCVHGFFKDKHRMKFPNGHYECKKCGRLWDKFYGLY